MKIEVSAIRISERVRRDTGDLTSLMESMKRHGQLNPVSVTRSNELVAGHRRLLSARKLGWQYIEASIIDRDSDIERLELELEENVHRKDFSPEELLAGYRRLDKLKHPSVARRIGGFFRGLFGRLFRRRAKPGPEAPAPPAGEPPATPDARTSISHTPSLATGKPAAKAESLEELQPGQYGI